MGSTKIEYVEDTWNPITGCDHAGSPGCDHCYARRMAKRLRGRCGYSKENPFGVTVHLDRLDEPMHWRKPRRIFVCSMGDLFHKDVPEHDIHRVLGIIAMCQEHDFLILTKRPERMAKVFANIKSSILRKSLEFLAKSGWPMKNLWLGVTAENQEQADIRIPKLLEIPAALHWASIEPMLGPVDFRKWLGLDCPQCGGCDIRADHDPACTTRWCDDCGYEDNRAKLGWIVCGGESGPGARPMHPDWPRKLRDDCKAAGVPFFFKQWGEWAHRSYVIAGAHSYAKINKTRLLALDDCTLMERVGKKAAGRLLDGKEHSEYPEGVSDA